MRRNRKIRVTATYRSLGLDKLLNKIRKDHCKFLNILPSGIGERYTVVYQKAR